MINKMVDEWNGYGNSQNRNKRTGDGSKGDDAVGALPLLLGHHSAAGDSGQ